MPTLFNTPTSSGIWYINGHVNVYCKVEGQEPKCNLNLQKVGPSTWVDYERGQRVQIKNGYLIVESI